MSLQPPALPRRVTDTSVASSWPRKLLERAYKRLHPYLTAWNYVCQWKRPVMSVSALSEKELAFFSPADLISSLSTAVIWGCGFWDEQLVYETTKYVKMESYSVSLIHPTDRDAKNLYHKSFKIHFTCNLVAFSCGFSCHVLKTFVVNGVRELAMVQCFWMNLFRHALTHK